MKTLHLFLLAAGIYCHFSVSATNYYVSNAGNDANNGLSLNTAFRTLQHAADMVQPGDSVLVADGAYTGFALWSGGTAQAGIVFKALGANALINKPASTNDGINIENADYVVLDGFIVNDQPRNGIRLVLSDHCIVRNCRCDNNFERGIFTGFTDDVTIEYNVCTNSRDEHGIYVSNSSDRPIIRYNTCYGNNNIGIHMNGDLSAGGDGIISDAQVYGNIIYDNNRAAGINMDGVENPLVYNNLIYNNHEAQGIALFQQDGAISSRGARIFNNTIIVPDDGRWGILVKAGSNVNTEIYNNIIINQHAWRGCIALEGTAGFKCDYNILNDKLSNTGDGSTISFSAWQALGFDEHSQLADPMNAIFSAPAQEDFHLKAGSQAIGKGTNLVSNIVKDDIAGNPRPDGAAYDVGAYEFQSTVPARDYPDIRIKLFPNPTRAFFQIEYDPALGNIRRLELWDQQGRRARAFLPAAGQFDLDGLAKGVYMLEIELAQRQLFRKQLVVR